MTRTNRFAAACIDTNSRQELLDARDPDMYDCTEWRITPSQWRVAVAAALAHMDDPDNDLDQAVTDIARDRGVDLDPQDECVIVDNAGGLTLQLRGWAHYYDGDDGARRAAEDVTAYLRDQDTAGWDGYDCRALELAAHNDDWGQYTVYTLDELTRDRLAELVATAPGYMTRAFAAALLPRCEDAPWG